MNNTKSSASKTKTGYVKTEKKQQKKKKKISPRSPLKVKDLNVSSSFSSSTSISSEAPSGCLRFFNSSSSAAKNACFKTPKSAPAANVVIKKCNTLQNPEKLTKGIAHRLTKKPPFSSRSDLSDKLASGSDSKLCVDAADLIRQQQQQPIEVIPCGVGSGEGKVYAVRTPMLTDRDVISKKLSTADFTPVTKLGNGFGFVRNDRNNSDSCSPVLPPVQVSVSPEIQGGSSSIVPVTPNTCYGAGHVVSGVSDKRKCKPRGILTIGENNLFGSSRTKVFDNGDENGIKVVNSNRISLVPYPTEASVHWLLSPCEEKRSEAEEDENGKGLRLDEYDFSMPFESIGCLSSPSSSLGFSSEVFNKSSSGGVTRSDSTTATSSSRKSRTSFMHSDSTFGSRGLLGPSFDHFVCNPSPSSPVSLPSVRSDISPGHATPYLEESLGSGNVIRTPQSNSSSPNFGLSHLSRDEISRLWFDYELDSVAEVLRRVSLSPDCQIPAAADSPRTSFEFNPLIKPVSSIDFSILRKAIDSQIPEEFPEPESEVRISWREGLVNCMFEMDEIDCCRGFSDEEDDANGYMFSHSKIGAVDHNKIADNSCDNINKNDEGSLGLGGSVPCDESTSANGGSPRCMEDSGWTVCYKNHLFQG